VKIRKQGFQFSQLQCLELVKPAEKRFLFLRLTLATHSSSCSAKDSTRFGKTSNCLKKFWIF